ncbi:hypothetical protein [Histophilus somni]|uniref:hypothetical protein n=1 Tax=Histophilus somni TaxID=731 RepID=UPI00094ADA0D|nr:hypothetical protein [Histophilus somni]
MSFWDSAWSVITESAKWMEKNQVATNLMGSVLQGTAGYFLQKEQAKNQMRQQRELLNLKDEMQSKYSAVPEVDSGYGGLVVDEAPNLANGGILTELKKRSEKKEG